MQAVSYRRFGKPDVLELGERPDPVPGRDEVLVRVAAAALNPKDVLLRRGKFRWMARDPLPRIPGYDFAGTVARAAGPWRAGDEVFGMIQAWRGGTSAELVACPVDQLARRPRSIDAVAAASLPLAALTALQALRDLARLRAGERACVSGASGGVGLMAIQLARILGAEVTAVCSRKNAALVTEHGAHQVVAYDEGTPLPVGFDVFFDVFGSQPYPKARPALAPRGRYVTTIPSPGAVVRDLATRYTAHPARLVVVKSNRRDLEQLAAWVDAGALRPVVDRVFPLAASAEAHAYLETKRARGKVVITLPAPPAARP